MSLSANHFASYVTEKIKANEDNCHQSHHLICLPHAGGAPPALRYRAPAIPPFYGLLFPLPSEDVACTVSPFTSLLGHSHHYTNRLLYLMLRNPVSTPIPTFFPCVPHKKGSFTHAIATLPSACSALMQFQPGFGPRRSQEAFQLCPQSLLPCHSPLRPDLRPSASPPP